MPRPRQCRYVSGQPSATYFKPRGVPLRLLEENALSLEGLEAMRLADLDGLTASQAAARMRISRHTFGRVLREARRAVAETLVQGRALRIGGGTHEYLPSDVSTQNKEKVMNNATIAIPSNAPGGLEAEISRHFGRCDVYTLVEIADDQIKSVHTLQGIPHDEGGCMAAVQYLAGQKVNALLAGGMGARPLGGFQQAGIQVLFGGELTTVGQAVQAYLDGKLPAFTGDFACKGH